MAHTDAARGSLASVEATVLRRLLRHALERESFRAVLARVLSVAAGHGVDFDRAWTVTLADGREVEVEVTYLSRRR